MSAINNAISFCLFGSDPMYCQGAIRNVELAPKLYPGWTVWIWLGDGVPDTCKKSLVNAGAVLKESPLPNPMLGRFLIHDQEGVDRYLIRDTDSRLNQREVMAVTEWLDSGHAFHIIRDHCGHQVVMPGGLWGGKTGQSFNMLDQITQWKGRKGGGTRDSIYNNDQLFLRDMIWPLVKTDCLQHDFCCRHIFRDAQPFPARFGDYRFCGERFSADDKPESYSWEKRIPFMTP